MEAERLPPSDAFARLPHELQEIDQWVNWRFVDERKVPMNPVTRGNAGVGWPNTWSPFTKALENYSPGEVGMGFVLTETDQYVCVDLDHCIDVRGEENLAARAVLDLLTGYAELSPSQQGLHVWVKSEAAIGNWKTKGIEIYSSARWMTVTGHANPHVTREIPERTAALQKLVAMYFARDEHPKFVVPEVPVAAPADDGALWECLFHSRQGNFFRRLYAGDLSVCYNDHSRAVIMLANQLAIVTNGDAGRMRGLLLQTGLVNNKWFTRRGNGTWLDYQIQDAIQFTSRRRR